MNREYKIDRRHQLKSIQNGLKILPWIPVPLVVAYFAGYSDSFFDAAFVSVVLIFNFILFLPAIILHLTYYACNKRTILKVDKDNRTLLITDTKGSKLLHYDDIKEVLRVIYSDLKHPEWQQNWQPMPWRNYGYLKLITKDNNVYLFSSLMLDPQQPPMKTEATLFKFIPLLDESIEETALPEEIEQIQREEINSWKIKFQHLSVEELERKTVGNGFRKEAVIAANELLEEKNTLVNIV